MASIAAHYRAHTKTKTGIWRDLAVRKRKTEVDAQLGPIVRFGQEALVPTPATQALIAMIHEIEAGQRPLAWENIGEIAAKAKSLSGTVMKEPFDVFDAGRMAVIIDPTGAAF